MAVHGSAARGRMAAETDLRGRGVAQRAGGICMAAKAREADNKIVALLAAAVTRESPPAHGVLFRATV